MPFYAVTNELLKRSFIVEDWKIAKALKTIMPIANVKIFKNRKEADTHVAVFRNVVLRKKCDNNYKSVEKKQFENPSDPIIHIKRINNAFNDLHSSVKLSPIIDDQVNILKTEVFCKLNTLMCAIKKEFEEDIKSSKKLPTSEPFISRTIDEQYSMSSVSSNTLPVATTILPDSLNMSPFASLHQSLTSNQLSTDKGNTKLTRNQLRNIRKRKHKKILKALRKVMPIADVNIFENQEEADTHVAAQRNFVFRKKCDNNNKSVEKKQFENPSDPIIHIERINIAINNLHSSVKLSPIFDDQVNVFKTEVFCKRNTLMFAIEKEFEEDIKSPKNELFTSEKNYCDGYVPSIEEDMKVINEILGDTPVQQTAIPRSETSLCYQETAPTNKAVKSFNTLEMAHVA